MKNNALTVPLCKRRQSKPPWYSKTDLSAGYASRQGRGGFSLFSRNNAPTSPPYKRTQRKPPWYSKTDFARLATPADKAVEVLGYHGGLYSNYPLYLGDVGHVSGTTSLRSPSCALRSV